MNLLNQIPQCSTSPEPTIGFKPTTFPIHRDALPQTKETLY
jgi:hypothetical protein